MLNANEDDVTRMVTSQVWFHASDNPPRNSAPDSTADPPLYNDAADSGRRWRSGGLSTRMRAPPSVEPSRDIALPWQPNTYHQATHQQQRKAEKHRDVARVPASLEFMTTLLSRN